MTKRFKVERPPDLQEILLDEEGFERLFDVRYLHHLEYANWWVEDKVRKQCRKALHKDRVGDLAKWLGKLYERKLDEGYLPDVTIRWINEEIGYGIFANRLIRRSEFVGEYTGIVKTRPLLFPRLNNYCFAYPRRTLTLRLFTIDSQSEGNFTRFINHSDTPNCESLAVFHNNVFHIIFRTLHDISPHTQLTYDYGDIFWKKRRKLLLCEKLTPEVAR